jgi:iron complex transport system substrate-binding protein
MKSRIFLHILLSLVFLAGPGCRSGPPRPDAPRPRVVTYSPALTEMVFALEMGDHVVGVTDLCDLPDGQNRPRLGDIHVSAEKILSVDPDLVLVQHTTGFEPFESNDDWPRVVHIRLDRLADVPAAAQLVASLLGDPDRGTRAAEAFQDRLDRVRAAVAGMDRPRVLLIEGTQRPAVHAAGTFVDDMLQIAGARPASRDIPGNQPWRQTRLERIVAAAPEVLLVKTTPEQLPAAREYWQQWEDIPAVAAGRVFYLTDDAWMRPGLHMARLAAELARMIHPDLPAGDDE